MESTPKTPWSRKRKLQNVQAKMERLREAKLANVTAQLSEDDSSESDEDSESFSNDDARQVYQEWLKEQPQHNVKMMAVMFMDALIDRFHKTTCGAANEVGLILSHNEKTIHIWRQDFYINQGSFTESRQGKHACLFILDDEGLWHKAGSRKCHNQNMTGAKFCTWVNTHLLPNAQLPPGCLQQIQTHTAIKWLHHLGNERDDVVAYRKLYLRKLEILSSTHLPPPSREDGLTAIQTGHPAASKHLVLIFHGESSVHANEGQSVMWGSVPIRPKNQGRGLIVSDFVTEFDGVLQLSIDEYRRAAESDPFIRMCAREIIKFGSGSTGITLKQMEMAFKIADVKYPSDKYSKVWVFDQSSGHCAFREDALNVGSGGTQP